MAGRFLYPFDTDETRTPAMIRTIPKYRRVGMDSKITILDESVTRIGETTHPFPMPRFLGLSKDERPESTDLTSKFEGFILESRAGSCCNSPLERFYLERPLSSLAPPVPPGQEIGRR